MKRILPALLALLLLAGCGRINQTEYVFVGEHNTPFVIKETTEPPVEEDPVIPAASNYYELRSVLQTFITDGVEHGQLYLVDYNGDVEQDLREVVRYLSTRDPIASYAADYITCERRESGSDWLVTVSVVFRRSLGEIQSIQSVRGNEAAVEQMLEALTQQQSSVTLQISGYLREDFAETLRQYCLQHPDEIVEAPEISVSLYPDSGNVRVVEIHYVYEHDRETLRGMKAEAAAVLDSAYNYIRYAKTNTETLELLYTYLISRFDYETLDVGASVYSLLCRGTGDSFSFASVVNWLCRKAGLECWLVEGKKNGEDYCWNILSLDGRLCHVDLQTDAVAGAREPTLRTDQEMENYSWDTRAYPACLPPEETGEPEPGDENTTEPSGG